MVFTFTELALVNLNGLVKTANFLGAAHQKCRHSLSTEHPPFSDGAITESMFMLYVAGRFATYDIVGNE
jgi:hypothetical protein